MLTNDGRRRAVPGARSSVPSPRRSRAVAGAAGALATVLVVATSALRDPPSAPALLWTAAQRAVILADNAWVHAARDRRSALPVPVADAPSERGEGPIGPLFLLFATDQCQACRQLLDRLGSLGRRRPGSLWVVYRPQGTEGLGQPGLGARTPTCISLLPDTSGSYSSAYNVTAVPKVFVLEADRRPRAAATRLEPAWFLLHHWL